MWTAKLPSGALVSFLAVCGFLCWVEDKSLSQYAWLIFKVRVLISAEHFHVPTEKSFDLSLGWSYCLFCRNMPILQRKTSISVLLKEIHINFFPNVNVLLSFGEQFALLRKCAYAFSSVRCLSLSIV